MNSPQLLLQKVSSPQDLKKLNKKELNLLAEEIRELIVSTVASNGGHLSSNLGAVELSIALHRVFNSPQDKIVWDVGHQCYAHKLLTGRLPLFHTLRKQNGLAGFPKTGESPHDAFNTGHASTSISAALGLLAADRLLGNKNNSIAVIGDGALTGGLAYEALSHAGHLGLPLIVILNDNKMSISPNVGGLSKYLSRLSMKEKYQTFRRHFDELAKKIPFIGRGFFNLVQRLKRAVKAVFYIDNFFVDLGFEYVGPIAGHNIQSMINVLEDVKKLNRPVVIHIITRKGKGYGYAEDDPGSYHGVGSFSVDGGLDETDLQVIKNGKTFTAAFSDIITEAGKKNNRVVAVSAAMKTGTGLSFFAKTFPRRFYDVGIAEEHAITFAAGLAAQGLKPVAAIYSTFIQRAVDQILHDAALQKLPVVIALDRAGFVGADGETHQGLFDIALFRSTPNLTMLCPASADEMKLMFDWAINKEQPGPVIIRYPKSYCPPENPAFSAPLETGRGVFVKKSNARVCLFFTGSLYTQALEAADILSGQGINIDLYNLRFISPIDEEYLTGVINEYKLAVFIEEGIKNGGFGEYTSALALKRQCKASILILAADKSIFEEGKALGTREELLAENGLDGKGIAKTIQCII
ncbi:MAG: 1-deoxy-D-xylulose-5-phosphate synthase [Treponema sp.]|jgi:1-deoxy-D-xylulose-5-phosphate synthase|nr:1-deoxy-D-xylulose-5-phosphate synthase [Treponema sp.]